MFIRPRRVTAALAVAAIALSLAACSTTKPEAGADGAVDNGGSLPAPGITADSVSVGYQVGDISALRKRLGFTGVDYGTYETVVKGVNAVVDHVNANGGMGGRTLKPILSKGLGDTGTEALCRQFTQDTPVFAAVITGAFGNATRPCYQDARTVMIDLTAIAHDQAELESFSPYLWAPTQPELGAFTTAQIQSLEARGWFGAKKGVAVVTPDAEVSRRVATEIVVPELKKVGLTNTPTYYIDASNVGSLGQTISNALAGAKSTGVDRVFVVGGARILGIMVSDVAANTLPVDYAMSTVDLPSFIVDNPTFIATGVQENMAGLGYSKAEDLRLSDEPFPDPAKPGEVLCKQIIDAAGAQPPEQYRENYYAVFSYCDATLLLDAALDKAPKDVTPNAFRDAVWSLGTDSQLALPETTVWGPNRYTAAASARPLAWNSACVLPGRTALGCFEYVGDAIPLTSTPLTSNPATTPATASVTPTATLSVPPTG